MGSAGGAFLHRRYVVGEFPWFICVLQWVVKESVVLIGIQLKDELPDNLNSLFKISFFHFELCKLVDHKPVLRRGVFKLVDLGLEINGLHKFVSGGKIIAKFHSYAEKSFRSS